MQTAEAHEAGGRAQSTEWEAALPGDGGDLSLKTLNPYETPVCPPSRNQSQGTQGGIPIYWTRGHLVYGSACGQDISLCRSNLLVNP